MKKLKKVVRIFIILIILLAIYNQNLSNASVKISEIEETRGTIKSY